MTSASTERNFIAYPTNRVVGTVGNAENAHAAVDALLKAGFDRRDIDILHGEQDVKRLDPTGAEHGFLLQFQRTLSKAFDLEEFRHLMHHVEDVRAGRYVIMVLTKERSRRIVAGDILHHHGAEFVGFYGRWAWEGIPPATLASPEDLATAFVRAWNERNPAALASLFDEDAEFVNVTGLCWHDRESIRKAHSDGDLCKSHLEIDDLKVKVLSHHVAVVHARMKVSDQADGQDGLSPHNTIVSFVVHRDADRWLCASAHTTDVVAAAERTS